MWEDRASYHPDYLIIFHFISRRWRFHIFVHAYVIYDAHPNKKFGFNSRLHKKSIGILVW